MVIFVLLIATNFFRQVCTIYCKQRPPAQVAFIFAFEDGAYNAFIAEVDIRKIYLIVYNTRRLCGDVAEWSKAGAWRASELQGS